MLQNKLDRFAAIPGLLITSAICYTLLGLQVSGYRSPEGSVDWLESHRTVVTILVQVLSQAFGMLHVLIICALARSTFLVSIASKPFKLRTVHFIQSATVPRMSWSLPFKLTIILFIIMVAHFLPAPLWAASIAPGLETREVVTGMDISSFNTKNISNLWKGNDSLATFQEDGYAQWLASQGLFSFDLRLVTDQLRDSASAASEVIGNGESHAKLDETGFRYLNRSYGAGGDAGFTVIPDVDLADSQSYEYTEDGFNTSVSCFYNQSMYWSVNQVATSSDDKLPVRMWQFSGEGASGQSNSYYTYLAWQPWDLLGWRATYDNATHKIQIQINTGVNTTDDGSQDPNSFGQFSTMQCNIDVQQQPIKVFVNNTDQTINTTPYGKPSSNLSSHNSAVAQQASVVIDTMSYNDGCLGGCEMGKALVINTNYYGYLTNNASGNATALQATEQFFAMLVDDTIIRLRQTRLVAESENSTIPVTAVVIMPAVAFGDKYFIWLLAVFNFLVIVAYAFEFARTRGWARSPPLDIMNNSQVLMAAIAGGEWLQRKFDGEKHYPGSRRISENTLLRLEGSGKSSNRLVFVPQLLDEEAPTNADEEELLDKSIHPALR